MRLINQALTERYKSHKGFTLIEMVLVIVVIGILAVAAIPRFSKVAEKAQISVNTAFSGALKSGVNMAHQAWLANSSSPNVTNIAIQNT